MFVNITEKPPWGSVIKAITYYLLLIFLCLFEIIWNWKNRFLWRKKTGVLEKNPQSKDKNQPENRT